MEYLQTWLDNSEIPIITAFLLGLLTAVSPCPLATNITAIGFISKDINNRNRIFTNGVLYTLGRVLAYSALGAILIAILRKGADMFAIQKGISEWGELLLAPALMLIGLFMLFGDKLQFVRPVVYFILACLFPCQLWKVRGICYLSFLHWQQGSQLCLSLGFWHTV